MGPPEEQQWTTAHSVTPFPSSDPRPQPHRRSGIFQVAHSSNSLPFTSRHIEPPNAGSAGRFNSSSCFFLALRLRRYKQRLDTTSTFNQHKQKGTEIWCNLHFLRVSNLYQAWDHICFMYFFAFFLVSHSKLHENVKIQVETIIGIVDISKL